MTSGRTLEWRLESGKHYHCRGKLGFIIMEMWRDRGYPVDENVSVWRNRKKLLRKSHTSWPILH